MIANKLLPLIALGIVSLLIFIGVKSCQKDEPDSIQLASVPVPGTPDADSPADTIRTLTAKVAEIRSESDQLKQQNEELLKQRHEIESRVKAELRTEMDRSKHQQHSDLSQELNQQLASFKQALDQVQSQVTSVKKQHSEASLLGGSDIPIGFGINDTEDFPGQVQELVWVEPLGTMFDKQGKPLVESVKDQAGSLLHTGSEKTSEAKEYITSRGQDDLEPDEPVYTVPRNSTLIGSTGMTALIGRIPFNGAIEDPFPFKVIVGKDNLTANGIEIPEIDGMIFSGKASGDWTLSCVRGQVHSVTYVFSDGSIRTLSSDDNSLNSLNQSGNSKTRRNNQSNQRRPLGWISDRRGIPCVSGIRISNTGTYLAGRILATAAEAAAGAFSQQQVTNTVSPLQGVTTSVITGDAVDYAASRAAGGAASEVSAYLRDRAAQSFDVIYVDVGSELAVHVDVELPIDYEPNGRKTRYAFVLHEDAYEDLD